jgi:diaminohydroxyphosphoribosylaminopyrimidine deaminase/5-amino-6-(5-phosphoribosylamino)uracil reductase
MSAFDDRLLMRRTLALASKGTGVVHPNPLVGCVIVKDGTIVAEGWHRRFGGPHAEVEALRTAGPRAKGATLYVNLEPCAHHGKTPPCTEAIVAAGVREVVVAVRDPHRLVAGRGMAELKRAGLQVRMGVEREAAEALNERFLTFHRTGTPFVGLKWAQSLDGRSVDHRGRSKWITGEEARGEVHRLRGMYDACLVGAGTIQRDDPRLTVRTSKGRDPVRVVLDGRLRVTGRERVFDGSVRTILLTDRKHLAGPNRIIRRLLASGTEVLGLPSTKGMAPDHVLAALAGEGITSVLVEGGPSTISRFLQSRQFHKIHAFMGPMILGGGGASVSLARPFGLGTAVRMSNVSTRFFADGTVLIEGYRERS